MSVRDWQKRCRVLAIDSPPTDAKRCDGPKFPLSELRVDCWY